MKYKKGELVRVSERLLTINYDETHMDAPTKEMLSLIGTVSVITHASAREYVIAALPDVHWIEEELDPGALNKGNFTNVKEV